MWALSSPSTTWRPSPSWASRKWRQQVRLLEGASRHQTHLLFPARATRTRLDPYPRRARLSRPRGPGTEQRPVSAGTQHDPAPHTSVSTKSRSPTSPKLRLHASRRGARRSPVSQHEGHGALTEPHQVASLRLGLQQPLGLPVGDGEEMEGRLDFQTPALCPWLSWGT